MVKELIICRGIPGSGKTTYAKEWAKCDSSNHIRLNLDDLRNMLGEYWVTKRERPIGEEVIRNMYNKYKDIIYK